MGQNRTCTICRHADRGLIDEQIAAKRPFRQIAQTFGLGRQSVFRQAQHKDRALEVAAERRAYIELVAKLAEYQTTQTTTTTETIAVEMTEGQTVDKLLGRFRMIAQRSQSRTE